MVAADSGAALLNGQFKPLLVVAAVAVMVKSPYRRASFCSTDRIFTKVEDASLLVIHELELCQGLLKRVKADIVHLDMSLGGLRLAELSAVNLSKRRISGKARREVLKILPRIRKISSDIRRIYKIEVLALGKNSIPVRIAELTAGAYAIIYSAEKAVQEARKVRLGLPAKCRPNKCNKGIELHSLEPAEHDIVGRASDENNVLEKVIYSEILNPRARGFRVLEINPRV